MNVQEILQLHQASNAQIINLRIRNVVKPIAPWPCSFAGKTLCPYFGWTLRDILPPPPPPPAARLAPVPYLASIKS